MKKSLIKNQAAAKKAILARGAAPNSQQDLGNDASLAVDTNIMVDAAVTTDLGVATTCSPEATLTTNISTDLGVATTVANGTTTLAHD